jgi:photosystem II stability/assembly factor-like uncharacterized protein
MNRILNLACGLMAAVLAAVLAGQAAAAPFIDVLERPSASSALAARAMFNGLAAAGKRLVAAGQRGHIVYSDDGGGSWRQASVPVSSDLVAIQFPDPRHGWAVGHDGVVLHSVDAGATWKLQLDGRVIALQLKSAYDRDGVAPQLRAAAKRLIAQGADQSLLDVWFDSVNSGFVAGAFGLVFHTEDGGATWQPWLDRVDNPNGLHLNAIRRVGGVTVIVGEQGTLLKFSPGRNRFEALASPYQGSYFGVTGGEGVLLAYGLRGNAYRSTDAGASWTRIETGVRVGLTAASALPDGRLVLVSQAGQILLSADHGLSFQPLRHAPPGAAFAVAPAGADGIVIGGLRGLRRQPLQ